MSHQKIRNKMKKLNIILGTALLLVTLALVSGSSAFGQITPSKSIVSLPGGSGVTPRGNLVAPNLSINTHEDGYEDTDYIVCSHGTHPVSVVRTACIHSRMVLLVTFECGERKCVSLNRPASLKQRP